MEEVLNVEDVHVAEVEVIKSVDSTSDEDLKKVEKASADDEDEFDLVSHSMPILVR